MIAYLEPITKSPVVALQRAVNGFRRREGIMPQWASAPGGVALPADEMRRLGLRARPGQAARPGHVLVGIDPPNKTTRPPPQAV